MKILGISAHYHDSAAALVIDGVPVCAVQEERLSRRKNDAAFPAGAIEWCLDHARLDPADLDAVVFYERSMLKFERILTCALRAFPRSWRSFPNAIKNSLGEKVWVRGIISSYLGVPRRKILFTAHHESHAAASFLTAATRRAAILTADAVGEWATLTVGHGERRSDGDTEIALLREIRFPHSLGMLYSTFTAYLGFTVNEDEYKVMGLAAYGRPSMVEQVRKLVRRTPDGAFNLDLDYFEYQTTARRSYSRRFVELFGPPRHSYEPIDLETAEGRRFADCAASVQRVLEDTLVDMTRAERNYLRIHADSLNSPFDINSGAKLILGSTAKLRTLVTYLNIVDELRHKLALLPRRDLIAMAAAKDDPLTAWAAGYLAKTADQRPSADDRGGDATQIFGQSLGILHRRGVCTPSPISRNGRIIPIRLSSKPLSTRSTIPLSGSTTSSSTIRRRAG